MSRSIIHLSLSQKITLRIKIYQEQDRKKLIILRRILTEKIKNIHFVTALKGEEKFFSRRIEIKGNYTLAELDSIIRVAFNHDTFDHRSELYLGEHYKVGLERFIPGYQ